MKRFRYWCPQFGLVHRCLVLCGWRELRKVYVDNHYEILMEAP